ncbi:DEAD/DEAH box helicase [Corynebacterium poyangense]|uniref:DEAD/DEAH box helicase n=1 Tax=Corynebacterium poyangense TaxID=2684405 RepID=UPI001CCE7687|nr:DEAD/DEAH box helicase [Corynebacterium poyangense]
MAIDPARPSTSPPSLGEDLLDVLIRRFPTSTCTHHSIQPSRPAQWGDYPHWVHPKLRAALVDQGITKLYLHQEKTADSAWRGEDTIVATGTSSGKSLGYLLPTLTHLAEDSTACALYLSPTKALGNDQVINLNSLIDGIPELKNVHPASYDGDTPPEARNPIRDHSRFIITNPDMLHLSLLAHHQRWARILRHLHFIIIDEAHTYRGVFGANVALVLRRLLRLASRYGSHPVIIAASATANSPADHLELLTGRPAQEISVDGAPRGQRSVVLWEPGYLEGVTGDHGAPVRHPASSEAALMMAALVSEGARTLTFVPSRRQAETVALRCAETLILAGRAYDAQRIDSYRAGYLAEDRRAIEKALDNGELLGVATTNALELGIDVGGLDAVITAGYPGTIASFWQQAGRAGRRGQGSMVVFIARDDPLDSYVVHHPEALLGKPVERAIFNPYNPAIVKAHIYCAAVEKPLSAADIENFRAERVVTELVAEGLLRQRPQGWFPTPITAHENAELYPDIAHSRVNIRGGCGHEVTLVDRSDGRVIGTIDSQRACSQVHPGAVYLHRGESFVVEELLLEDHLAFLRPETPDYTTSARHVTDISILEEPEPNDILSPHPGLSIANVDVEVTQRVLGFATRRLDGEMLGVTPLDLPAHTLQTRAVAYTVDPTVFDALGITAERIPGTLHAAEHAAIGMLPLLATCDRWDIGGVSTAHHPDTDLPTVFVYDGNPGGAGFADCGFQRFQEWITATFETVHTCECEHGCPSCVQSPKCGNGNDPLDKEGALKLLEAMVIMLDAASPSTDSC